jgi:hypothetical protein
MEEQRLKTRRALEAERKGLEVEMGDIIYAFNQQLVALAATRAQVRLLISS